MKVQNQTNVPYFPSFKAKPGKHLINYLSKNEFNSEKIKISKFENLFSDAFANITDNNTIIDIDKNKNLIYSHLCFPNIKYCYKIYNNRENFSAQSILNECSKTIATGETVLFQHIIKTEVENGNSLKQLRTKIQTHFSEPKKFLKTLNVAERIKLEFPNSKLNNEEFERMRMQIGNEYLKSNSDKSMEEIISGLRLLV
ncbi:unknown [Clostridium sp. CAG:967]|nr:unknown [Clostridium sp. CAG:967]